MTAPSTILSIQSHVVSGHVGNRAAVFPLELMGHEVFPIHTVQYSSHTGKPGWKGMRFDSGHIRELLDGLEAVGALSACSAVLSGYIGTSGVGATILDAVARVRANRPEAVFCCDPVMGDYPGGLYVQSDIVSLYRDHALPLADIVTPNHFEAELLTGSSIRSEAEAKAAADLIHDMGPSIVIITSCLTGRDSIQLLLSCSDGKFSVETPMIPFEKPPKGSGDLFAALFLGKYLLTRSATLAFEYSCNAIWSILERTFAAGEPELSLARCRDLIDAPSLHYASRRL